MKIEFVAKLPENKGHFLHYFVNFRVLKKYLLNFFAYKKTSRGSFDAQLAACKTYTIWAVR